jgi:hypothetical protein
MNALSARARLASEAHNPRIVWGQDIIWSFDLMVLKVFQDGGSKPRTEQFQADVSSFAFAAIRSLTLAALNDGVNEPTTSVRE